MINAFQKFILWCITVVAISIITIFVLYRLAWYLAILIGLLAIGGIIGTPLVWILKSKYRRAIREEEKRWKNC